MANWDSRFEKWFYIIYVICTPKSLVLSFICLFSKIQTKTRWNEVMYSVCVVSFFKKKKKSNLMCFSTKLHSKEAKTSPDTSHISYRKQKSLCLFSHAQWRTMSFFLLHTVVCLRSKEEEEEEEIKFMEGTALILLNKSTFFNLIKFQSFITILSLLPLSLLTIYFGWHCFPYY